MTLAKFDPARDGALAARREARFDPFSYSLRLTAGNLFAEVDNGYVTFGSPDSYQVERLAHFGDRSDWRCPMDLSRFLLSLLVDVCAIDGCPLNAVNREATFGSGLQGVIKAEWGDLLSTFGQPNVGPSVDGKVRFEWAFLTDSGVLFTIYDWKDSDAPEDIQEWHVGGFKAIALAEVKRFLGDACLIIKAG